MDRNSDGQLSRTLRQHLESFRRAGLTYFPRFEPAADHSVNIDDQIPADRQAVSTAAVSSQAVTPHSRSLFGDLDETSAGNATVNENEAATLSLPERRKKLETLATQVAACQRCQELAGARTQTVFGVGNPQARIMFIGEAPGADEDRQGEPFVGRAGQLLDRIIVACKLKREDVYICNILKCRPPGNRNPSTTEAANCREFLDAQIATVDPEYIVCWGTVAAQNLLDTTTTIGKLRKQFFSHGRAKVLCTYHPSYLLRNPAAKKDVWDDMKFLFREMDVELD